MVDKNTFADIDQGPDGGTGRKLLPLFALNEDNKINDDEVALAWARTAKDKAMRASRERLSEMKKNIALYSGREHRSIDHLEERARTVASLPYSPPIGSAGPATSRVIVNHLYDLTENRVARYMRYSPNIDILPAQSDEQADREAASLVKELVDYLQYENQFEALAATMARRRTVTGESYIFVEWDPGKGDMRPEMQFVKGLMKKTPGEDFYHTAPAGEEGSLEEEAQETPEEEAKEQAAGEGDNEDNQETIDKGPKISHPSQPLRPGIVHIGDVSMRVPLTYNIFLQPAPDGDFDKVDWVLERRFYHVEELKAMYPQHADEIENKAATETRDSATAMADDVLYENPNDEDHLTDHTIVWELWHRKTQFLPDGRHMVFLEDTMLQNEPLPYEHGQVPCLRITDIDIDGKLYGQATFSMVRELNTFLNNLYTMTYQNQVLCSYPKWLVHKTSGVKKKDLGNNSTIVGWQGQYPPELKVFNNTPKEMFALMKDLEDKEQQLFGVFGVSRGEPPPGIKAGIALQFLNEQENERFNNDIKKHNAVLKAMWVMILAVIKQFYKQDDGRLLKIFGKNQEYRIKRFNPAILDTPFDVRIQNASNLPDSKAARTQYLLDIDERKPIPDDVFFDYLNLGIPDAYTTEVTEAKRAADIENKGFVDGDPVAEPEPWEDHLAHWHRHFLFYQSLGFKELPIQQRNAAAEHLQVHEMMLLNKAFLGGDLSKPLNPMLVQLLEQLPMFPAIYTPNTATISGALDPAMKAQMDQGSMSPGLDMSAPPPSNGPSMQGLTASMQQGGPIATAPAPLLPAAALPPATGITKPPSGAPLKTRKGKK